MALRILLPIVLLFFSLTAFTQQICDANGNLVIYSNYDGGIVTINVDQDIPNLIIGICTYEPANISLSGAFVNNVARVVYAGFNSTQNNNNCNQGNFPTSINGVPTSIADIIVYPPSPLINPNGWPNILGVAGACDASTNAGGGNTPDQVVAYFEQETGGVFRSHVTQYNCWQNTVYNISDGGNCCITGLVTAPSPVASFQANQTSICVGSCINFSNTSTGGPFSSTQWTFSGSDNAGPITTENPSNICYSIPGTFSVSLQVTNSNGTASTSQQNFIVVSESVVPEINFSYPEFACSTIESILPQINSGNTSGGLFSSQIGLQINQQTGEINPSVSTPGLYNISYTVESLSCQGQAIETSDSFQIDISEAPELSLNLSGIVSLCEGETVELIAQGQFETYQWSNANTTNSIIVSEPGEYSVLALNQVGCQVVSDTVSINVYPLPQASFSYNQISNYVVEFTNTSLGLGNSFWSFGFGDSSMEQNPSYDFPFDDTWPVTLNINNACGSDSIQTFVNVIKSSTNDLYLFPFELIQVNGSFILSGLSNKPQSYLVKVFDMQGKSIVNQEVNVQGNWSHSFQMNTVASGIYLLSVSDTNSSYQQKLFIQR